MIRIALFTLVLLIISSANQALAELTEVEITDRQVFEFKTIQYQSVSGYFHFLFDPSKAYNQIVTDIELATINENGMVAAKASFYLIEPINKKVSGTLFEISNRGSKASLRYFNQAVRDLSPATAEALGDGLIQDLGLRALWVGWQADVPIQKDSMHVELPVAKDIEGLVRSDWTLEEPTTELQLSHKAGISQIYPFNKTSNQSTYLTKRHARNGQRTVVSKETWQFNDEGSAISGDFSPGIYELVYPSNDPMVIGIGLAILRDTAVYLKSEDSKFPTPKVIGFGVSQTGRLLRHFLYNGFNQTPSTQNAFDGMLIHTAGAGRGSFNHRFGQPSRDAHRLSAFFYPTDIFPFTSRALQHPITGEVKGMLENESNLSRPKIFYTNTGYEYWGRAASLIHTSASSDVLPLENERIYHLASAQHFVESKENLRDAGNATYVGNPLDFLTHLRALLKNLTEWVTEDIPPPASKFPRFQTQTLVDVANYQLPNWLTFLSKPQSPHTAYYADYGPNWKEGIVDNQPPKLLAEIVPTVPAIDQWGNELGGIRHPMIEEPLAAFLPWATRDQKRYANEMMDFRGTLVLMKKSDVLARYKNWTSYLNKLNASIDASIQRKELLPRDRERTVEKAKWLWQKIMDSN